MSKIHCPRKPSVECECTADMAEDENCICPRISNHRDRDDAPLLMVDETQAVTA